MNNKGQVVFFGLMLGITIIVLALSFAYPIKESADIARNTTGLNCTNPLISDYDKATCVVVDLNPFYLIGGLIFIAGTIITARILMQ